MKACNPKAIALDSLALGKSIALDKLINRLPNSWI